MCSFLANSLKDLGRKIIIHRLNSNGLSREAEEKIGFDVASEESCKILSRAGITDGQQIHGEALRSQDDEKFKMLKNVFENLPNINERRKDGQSTKTI